LSDRIGTPISQADVLGWAIEGHVALSVRLPGTVQARTRHREGDSDDHEWYGPKVPIHGVWDLSLTGAGSREVKRVHQIQARLSTVPADGNLGAIVERDGSRYQLPPDRGELAERRGSAFPVGTELGVRMAVLQNFADEHGQSHKQGATQKLVEAESQGSKHAVDLTASTITPNQKRVNDYLLEASAVAGERVPENVIWKQAGYTTATEFRKWKKGQLSPRSVTTKAIEEVLSKPYRLKQ
jgi:hypothetical protein